MSTNFTTWQQQVAVLCGVAGTNAAFQTEVPAAIDYAEQRIYRDLDLISTIVVDDTTTCLAGARSIVVPSAFVVVNSIYLLLPAGNSNPLVGSKQVIEQVSLDYINWVYPPTAALGGPPQVCAYISQNTYAIGPTANLGYFFETVGTQRPAPLSSSNATTFLTLNLPDLWEAATMIHFSGQMKNFGAQSDDPRMSVSWEGVYAKALASADAEELRKRYAGTSIAPIPGTNKQPVAAGAARG